MHGLCSLYQLSRSQWWSARKLSAHRNAALARLVQHAYKHVPHYRRLFDKAGVKPEEIRSVADLVRIPVTTKRDLQKLPREEKTARTSVDSRCESVTTSGSSGEPLEVFLDPVERGHESASFMCVYMSWGVRPWDRLLAFETRPHNLQYRSWYERFGFFRRCRVPSFDLPERWIESVRQWKPALVQGHAVNLKLFASVVRESRMDIRIPIIVNTGGGLDPGGRRMLEEVFGCRVVDVYASVEAGVIAWECPLCRQYHVHDDFLVLELLEDGNSVPRGQAGEVVITVLSAFTMPLIRYHQGDVAVMSHDSPRCGRVLPLMKAVLGRTNDFIVLPSGRRLSPQPVMLALGAMAGGVGEWQMIQQADYSIDLSVVPLGGRREEVQRTLMPILRQKLGHDLTIRVLMVDRIQRNRMQKMRLVISYASGGKGYPDSFE
jgi:phenylacetate-CoA ligase